MLSAIVNLIGVICVVVLAGAIMAFIGSTLSTMLEHYTKSKLERENNEQL